MVAIDELLKELSSNSKDVVLLIREMSGVVSYYRRLLEKFELDALTGLPGSAKYRELVAEMENGASGVGVVVFDVNDLKYYNDSRGHQAGDLLLQKAAESFHFISGPCVRVFRTGGDEFVAIITNCAEGGVGAVVEKWQGKLAELNEPDDGIRCTIAHGTAFGPGGHRLSELLALADERMYAEKRRMKEAGLKIGDVR